MLEERMYNVTDAEPVEQWTQMMTIIQELWLKLLAFCSRNTKTDLIKQIKKSKSWTAPATIVCPQNLIIKLLRLHTRLPAVQSGLNVGPSRINRWTALAERTQRYCGVSQMRAFYEARKAVCGPSHQIQTSLRSSDGSILLTDKEVILQRWSDHFEGPFSDQSSMRHSSLAKISQMVNLMNHSLLKRPKKPLCSWRWALTSNDIDGIPAKFY